jgi:FkbM family methyltransferase
MDILELLRHENRSDIETYVRSQARVVPADDDRVIARVLDSFLLYLDMRDTSIAPHLAMDGFWEMWATIAVARYVKPGMRCIDIGANFGYYTMLLTRLVGSTGEVQAWEPMAEAQKCLVRSLSVNGAEVNMSLILGAASDKKFENRALLTPLIEWGDSRLSQKANVASGIGDELVSGGPVDGHSMNLCPVNFIKIDVEGHEAEVWAGMRETLKASPSIQLMVEFDPGKHEEPRAFLEQVSADGFGIQGIAENGDLVPVRHEYALDPGVKWLWLAR